MFELQLHHVALTVTDMAKATWFYGDHLALRVKSFEDTVARLKSCGVACLELPDNPTPWAQIYATDPDGNIIEFNVDRDARVSWTLALIRRTGPGSFR